MRRTVDLPRRLRWLPLWAGLLFLALVAPGYAQQDGLGLSDEQKTALRQIHNQYEGKRQEARIEMQTRRLELVKLVRTQEPDKEAIKAKMREVLSLEGRRQELIVDEIFEAKKLLTPEQFQTYRRKVLQRMLDRKDR